MRQGRDRVRALILELWERTRIDWGFATDRIADAFRRERSLSSAERREVAETLYGMIRQARRVDHALEVAGCRLKGARRDLARYVCYRLLAAEWSVAQAREVMPEIAWEVASAVEEAIARERDQVRRLALSRSLPDWLARRFLEEFGDEADALAASLNTRAPLTVRANRLKTSRESLSTALKAEGVSTRPTAYAVDGLVLETRVNVFALRAFREGLFEAQDEASQLVSEVVAPPPRGLVVDACAGAGGKTLAIAAMLGNKGRIVSLDVDGRKLVELRRRARRAGLSNVQAIEVGHDAWPDAVEALRGQADRVLVDAPCSGIGALRRNPEARWRLTEAELVRFPRQQEAIARRACDLVAPGGRLIYATCTVLRDENEAVVSRILDTVRGFELVRVAELWGSERARAVSDPTGTYLKLLPHRQDTDGFFAAILRRSS